MLRKRARAIVLISFLLLAVFADMSGPRPAAAGANLGVVIGATVGVVLTVTVVGTWIIYSRKYNPGTALVPDYEQPLAGRGKGQGVRFAPNCRTLDGHVPIACW